MFYGLSTYGGKGILPILKLPSISPRPRRVKTTFTWSFAVVLVLLLAVFIATVFTLEKRVRDHNLAERVDAVDKFIHGNLDKDGNLMRAVLRTLQEDREIGTALAARDRPALLAQTSALFESLRTDQRLTHLYFDDPELVNLLRLHSPASFGDVIHRKTALLAQQRGHAISGLELGPLGTLTLRTVSPWLQDGHVLGYVEIGEEIEHIVEEVHDNLLVDMFVLVDKRFISEQQWRRGLTLLKRQGQWDRFAVDVAVAQTESMPTAINDQVLANLRSGGSQQFTEDGRVWHLSMLALKDASDQRIGELVVIRDMTTLQNTFLRSTTIMTLLSVIAAAGVWGLYYFAMDRLERDYQRRHELEHQLLRMNTEHQRMLQIEKLSALGTMVGEIAHQLNNPLVGVVNLAQLAKREVNDPVRTRELLGEIRRAGQDCHALIQSMLSFSKVSTFESSAVLMADVIEEAAMLFRQTEGRRSPVVIRLPDRAVTLTVDPILIRHALFNLLTNAAHATPDDGQITIALESSPNPETGLPGWLLSVSDQGSGVSPEIIDRIFEPFFTTRKDGTGLGLPVVQHVALLHHGTVSVRSLPSGGTQFAIWLPEDGSMTPNNG
jgi:signal transduction histidine kinase